MGGRVQSLVDFLKYGIWRIRLSSLPPKKLFLIKSLRVVALSIREFGNDKCQLRASALTFYSLTSLVPVVAMFFGIAKGFGFETVFENLLREKLAGQEQIAGKIVEFSHSLLANTKGGLIAGVGLIALFWSVISMLGQIEDSMSDIWGIKDQRTFGRKFGDYLSIVLICPVLILLSSSLTVFVTTQVTLILEKIHFLGALGPFVLLGFRLIPLMLVWALLTFIYIFMPNAKVRFSSGLLGGVVAGSIYQLVQWIYINLQVGTSSYNAVYGSFAALPLFLVWLQTSWRIVLFGSELSWASQNVGDYEFETECSRASHRLRTLLSLWIMQYLVRNFDRQETPPSAGRISQELGIPKCLADGVITDLVESRLVFQTESGAGPGYEPAVDIHILKVQYVIDALECKGINEIPFIDARDYESITNTLELFRDRIEKLPENKLLKDL